MNLSETLQRLARANVPKHFYAVNSLGVAGECVCIAHDPDGVWRTYFSERGQRSDVVDHADEAAACAAFLEDVASITEELTGQRPSF